MIFTAGNILTLIICLVLVTLFRQLDRNNRTLEKVKKFGDKLKDELDSFVKERTSKLEESTISLNVEQTKAVAAVKRLESIKDDLVRKEAELMERSKSVDDFGKQIASYDATIKQLLEMTALAESNLSKVASESDFVDGLGKKLMASQKQLAEITASIPALQKSFEETNRVQLSGIRSEAIAEISRTVGELENRIGAACKRSDEVLETTGEKIRELYAKSHAEAARRADALEDAAFTKLKEQASERLVKYKEAIEEKTSVLQEQVKERILETQQLAKSFRSDWQAEAADYLEATRAEMQELDRRNADAAQRIEERIRSAGSLAETRAGEIEASIHEASVSAVTRLDAIGGDIDKRLNAMSEFAESRAKEIGATLAEFTGTVEARFESVDADVEKRLASVKALAENQAKEISAAVVKNTEAVEARFESVDADVEKRLASVKALAENQAKEISAAVAKNTEAVEARLESIDADVEKRLASVKALAENQAKEISAVVAKNTEAVEARLESIDADVEKHLASVKVLAETQAREIAASVEKISGTVEARLGTFDADVEKKLRSANALADAKTAEIGAAINGATVSVETRIDAFGKDVDYRISQFDKLIGDAERLDGQLRIAMQETEKRVTGEFGLYAQDQQTRFDAFSKKLLGEADTLASRMQTVESALNELKSRAYENVSEKLKIFEDDFFADLAKRSDAITASLDHWKANVDERLESLSSESESVRKDVEASYTLRLKERLSEISDQYRTQTAKLEDQIGAVESELRSRITASDQSILAFTEQVRQEFELARGKAALDAKNELDAHALSVQETLRKQEREVESRTKDFIATIEAARTESETVIDSIRNGFTAWQTRNEQQLAEAKSNLSDKIASLGSATDTAIADLEGKYQTNYRDFIAKTTEERKQYKEELDSLKKEISAANAEFDRRSKETLGGLTAAYDAMTSATAKRVQEATAETDQTVRNLKTMIQDIRETVDSTRDKLMQKLQGDTGSLAQTLEEIDKKQKSFIAQTKIFERADDLKASLENDIETIKGEISRLDVYRDTMNGLEQQYGKIRKLEEDVSQRVTKFTTEKKRIDIIESDFNKLLALSDSIDKKMQELTISNDDLQQFQVQIRRFEESITDVNGRYERLEKKAVVLDQTVSGIDKAFENLKSLEASLHSYRESLSGMPEELESVKHNIDTLLENREKTSLMVEQLSALDAVIEDVEKRTEKMQTAREWLARTETRLEEISRQSQDQLKLLGDIMKDDGAAKKSKGAPPIGIRENVVKLAHQGWKVDEIARALHLSRGEVELILEMPQK